jgi:predicted HicB family RNase H-like nuclease
MPQLKTGRPSRKDRAIIEVQKDYDDDTVRMNVNLSRSFHKLIKQKALDMGVTVTTIVKDALDEYISKGLNE